MFVNRTAAEARLEILLLILKEYFVLNYSSFPFLIFISLTILVYFLFPIKKYKWTVLLSASVVFYLLVGYQYAYYILFTTVSTYFAARVIDSVSSKSKALIKENKASWSKDDKKQFKKKIKVKKRIVLAFALIANFGVLAFLKYYNFFSGSILNAFGIASPVFSLVLPIGISFYTFQSMGYIIDVYREKFPAEKNLAKYALFVTFFPQIIQGPISFYNQLANQLYAPHKMDFTRLKYGCELILWGFFKKLIIADRAVSTINMVLDNYNAYNGTTLTYTVLLYSIQLYADFSGGIDITRGIAQILGIDMAENFRRPYFSRSISEYWRRWHITLGAWMKEYVFYPIAMSALFINTGKRIKNSKFGSTKCGAYIGKVLPTSVASLIVFLIVGIWHGASWKYVGFGLWNGSIIMLSTLLKPLYEISLKKLHINPDFFLWRLFQIFRTFLIIAVGYVFDIAPEVRDAFSTIFRILFQQNLIIGFQQIKSIQFGTGFVAFGTAVMLFVSIIQERNPEITIRQRLDKIPFLIRWLFIFVSLLFVLVFGIYGPGFHPADFVYAQF